MFRGSTIGTLDRRGRLQIPAIFHGYLEQRWSSDVVLASEDGTLLVYPNNVWKAWEGEVKGAPITHPEAQYFRLLSKSAVGTTLQRDGRLVLPATYRKMFPQEGGELVVSGRLDHLVVFSRTQFETLIEENPLTEDDIGALSAALATTAKMLFESSRPMSRLAIYYPSLWRPILRRLADHPQLLYELSPRQFEEVVAELLDREGLEVKLTPPSRDGGRDILAWSSGTLGRHLYYVECKRWARQRPVGVEPVRALLGVVEIEKATAGVLVTTSRFTRGALKVEQKAQYRLSLRDYDALAEWLRRGE